MTAPTPLTLIDSTVSGNTALIGGGIDVADASLSVINSTVSSASVRNSIVADSLGGGENCEIDTSFAPFTSQGFNLESASSCGFDQPTDLAGTDPMLGPLAGNGGPTQTHALPESSPAVDRGNSGGASADQRGEPRPSDFPGIANAPGGNGADIGAFELQAPPPPPPPNGGPPPPSTEPSNQFRFTKVRKNKRRGIATLRVRIPGPGALRLRKNRKVKRVAKTRESGGNVRLKVRPRRKARRKLSKRRLQRSGRRRARVRVRARVTYRPTGGEPRTKTRRLRLVRKRARRR